VEVVVTVRGRKVVRRSRKYGGVVIESGIIVCIRAKKRTNKERRKMNGEPKK